MACFTVPMALGVITTVFRKKVPETYHINWLNAMLGGGTVMLAIEHIAHGEITLYPPFLTAGLSEALPEMITVGIPMVIAIVVTWAIMLAIIAIGTKVGTKHEAIKT